MDQTLAQSPPSETALSSEQIEQFRQKAKSSLFFLAKGILGYDWLDPEIHGPICRILEDPEKRDVLIGLPRGWQKSSLVSICYPIFAAINNHDVRICIVQNTASNAHAKLAVVSQKIKLPLMQLLFPELQPTKDCIWRQGAYQIPRAGNWPEATFESAGRDTDLTGRHYDIIIKDDLIAPDESSMSATNVVPSRRDVEQAIGFNKSIIPILDPKNYRSIDVGTRWRTDDYIQYHLDKDAEYFKKTGEHLSTIYMRAVRENDKGESDDNGHLVFPKRFDDKVLARLRSEMGPYLYSCLYMNRPIQTEDMVFNPEWFETYETEPRDLLIYTTVDFATDPKESKSNDLDYFVVMTVGVEIRTGLKFVLKYSRERCNMSRQINLIFEHVKEFSPYVVGLGAVGAEKNMKHWIEEKMRLMGIFFSVVILKLGTHADAKWLRILCLQPMFENRMIRIRPWMTELVNEAIQYGPHAAHDDLLDCLSMQLGLWQNVRIVKEREETRDQNPLSVSAGITELLKKNRKQKDEVFGELIAPESRFHSLSPMDMMLN